MKLTAFMVAFASLAVTFGAEAKSPLKRYLWENRLWVIFADGPSDPSVSNVQSAIKTNAAGLAERHMVVIAVYRDRVETLFKTMTSEDIRGGQKFAANLRARLDVKAGARKSFLIGKDTGVKSVSDTHRAIELFAQIDRMPMRRQEMKRQELRRQKAGG